MSVSYFPMQQKLSFW